MLIPIEEALYAQPPRDLLFRIKEAGFQHLPRGFEKQRRKATKYFGLLCRQTLFTEVSAIDEYLLQELRASRCCFLGIRSSSKNFFVAATSTRRSLNAALNACKAFSSESNIFTISGMCLFGSGRDAMLLENGERLSIVEIGGTKRMMPEHLARGSKVSGIVIDDRFSLYEVEKVLRLSSFLGIIKNSKASGYPRGGLMTPGVQYLLYLMPVYNAGGISPELYLQWGERVRERESRISEALALATVVDIERLPSSLEPIEDYVLDNVKTHRHVLLDEVLGLLSDRSETWRDYLVRKRPATWKELINASYVVTFLSQSALARDRGRVLIHVDDPVERVILAETERLHRLLKRDGIVAYPIVGLYALQRVVEARIAMIRICTTGIRARMIFR